MCNFCTLIAGGNATMNAFEGYGLPVIVSYSFATQQDLGAGDLRPADEYLKANFRQAVEVVEEATGIRFVEVESSAREMITVAYTARTDGFSYASYPNASETSPTTSGWIAMNLYSSSYAIGSAGFQVILHEIGHAVGLKHPFQGPNTLDPALDNTNNTVMSYNWAGRAKTDYQILDKQALDALYGPSSALDGVTLSWNAVTDVLKIKGSTADEVLIGVNDSSLIIGHGGSDRCVGRSDDDTLKGANGNDILKGNNGNDLLLGGRMDDTLIGGLGDDWLRGEDGNDLMRGDRTTSSFWDDGVDRMFGGNGNDTMYGGEMTDFMFGEAGNDLIYGESGNDRMQGGSGTDTLYGGSGLDVFIIAADSEVDIIADFNRSQGDRIDVSQLGIAKWQALKALSNVGADKVMTIGNVEVVLLNKANEVFDGTDFLA